MGSASSDELDDREGRSRAAAQGRYGRNAMVQGAAAEFFKVWAVTVRSRAAALDARVVLCLHDELLVHAPAEHGAAVAGLRGRLSGGGRAPLGAERLASDSSPTSARSRGGPTANPEDRRQIWCPA